MQFHGLDAWRQDYGQVECWIGNRVVNLRNSAHFVGFRYQPLALDRRALVLSFNLAEGLGGAAPSDQFCRLELRFLSVAALSVEEVGEEFTEELSHDLHHWDYFEREGGGGVLKFEVGGLNISFTALEVALRLLPLPPEASESSWT